MCFIICVLISNVSTRSIYPTVVRGDVKLFDFGLATIMPKNGDPYEDKFEMSGAGTYLKMSDYGCK